MNWLKHNFKCLMPFRSMKRRRIKASLFLMLYLKLELSKEREEEKEIGIILDSFLRVRYDNCKLYRL